MGIVVYMFHAIGSITDDDWADPHYGYDQVKFYEILANLEKVQSLRDAYLNKEIGLPIFTFDDGHISNYYAAKYMKENGFGTADFFINPEKVGSTYYMNWEQIRELNQWGMSIQSHGLDHQYLSDCDDVELHRQLLKSKEMIEIEVGEKVTILAPPGGRYDKRVVLLSKKIGYKVIANSQPGYLKSFNEEIVPRFAVLKNYSVNKLLSLESPINALSIKVKTKFAILSIIKMLLGNTHYDKFRLIILGDK